MQINVQSVLYFMQMVKLRIHTVTCKLIDIGKHEYL